MILMWLYAVNSEEVSEVVVCEKNESLIGGSSGGEIHGLSALYAVC